MKKFIATAIAVMMGITMLTSTIFAGEGEKEQKAKGNPPVFGKVEVVKDGDNITEIKIVGKGEPVIVLLDDKGKELAALEGKMVKVKGEKDADGKLKVAEFEEKTNKGEKKGKEKKEAKSAE